MFFKLLILFIVVPLIEIALLIKIGKMIGLWPTLFIIIATGFMGAALARFQGFLVMKKIKNELSLGNMPADELIDGLLILIGGIVLLTPGLITDAIGFLMLIPWSRKIFKTWLVNKFRESIQNANARITYIDYR